MSVYIPGMEMPKSCPCELLGIGYDLCCSFAGGIPARVKEYYECCQNDTKPSWCPLVPVPQHGRLKDYDSVMERYSKWFRNTENREYENMFYMLQNELCGAPTIIPADKEGKA